MKQFQRVISACVLAVAITVGYSATASAATITCPSAEASIYCIPTVTFSDDTVTKLKKIPAPTLAALRSLKVHARSTQPGTLKFKLTARLKFVNGQAVPAATRRVTIATASTKFSAAGTRTITIAFFRKYVKAVTAGTKITVQSTFDATASTVPTVKSNKTVTVKGKKKVVRPVFTG